MAGGIPGTKGPWVRRVGTTDDSTSAAVAGQPPIRPVRAGPARGWRLCQVVCRTCLCTCSGPGACGAAPDEFSAVSAAAKTWLVLRRAGDGEAQESAVEQLTCVVRNPKGVDH